MSSFIWSSYSWNTIYIFFIYLLIFSCLLFLLSCKRIMEFPLHQDNYYTNGEPFNLSRPRCLMYDMDPIRLDPLSASGSLSYRLTCHFLYYTRSVGMYDTQPTIVDRLSIYIWNNNIDVHLVYFASNISACMVLEGKMHQKRVFHLAP